MNITLTTSELCEMLGVTNRTLKAIITRNTLEERLRAIGLELISTYKVGRGKVYAVKQLSSDDYTLDDFMYELNIRDMENFEFYVKQRTSEKGLTQSKASIAEITGVNVKQIQRWDDKLMKKNIIEKDKVVYLAVQHVKNSNEVKTWFVSEDIYKDYKRRNYKWIQIIEAINKGNMDDKTKEAMIDIQKEYIRNEVGYYVYPYTSYKLAENAQQLIELMNKRVGK